MAVLIKWFLKNNKKKLQSWTNLLIVSAQDFEGENSKAKPNDNDILFK
jgi:hypothetical protein